MNTLTLVSLYLPDTWKGVEIQGPYGILLREVNMEIKYWTTKKGAKSVILGCDAQVEFQSNQEPFIGCALHGGKSKNISTTTWRCSLNPKFTSYCNSRD